MEEEGSGKIEFPSLFDLGDIPGYRYHVHGEAPSPVMPALLGPSSSTSSASWASMGTQSEAPHGEGSNRYGLEGGWHQKSPWSSLSFSNTRLPNPLAFGKRKYHRQAPVSEPPSIKKNIPYVKLLLNSSGNKCMLEVDSVQTNIYLKLPESAICVAEILTESSCRILHQKN